jgi:hypothetical protein
LLLSAFSTSVFEPDLKIEEKSYQLLIMSVMDDLWLNELIPRCQLTY